MLFKTETKKIERLPFFDFLKMFAMFFVLWGHAIQHLQSGEVWDETMHKIIYSFHLPLFMTIAGFFSLSSMNLGVMDFLKKKGVQLILPCITWGLALYGVIFFMNVGLGASISYNPFFVFFQHFWFLKSLFVCYLIAYFGNKFCNRLTTWIFATLIIAHISSTHQIPIMYCCFMTGLLIRKYFGAFKNNYKLMTAISGIMFFTILIITSGNLPLKGINLIDLVMANSTPPSHGLSYINKIIASVSSSIFFIGLFYWLSLNPKFNNYMVGNWLTDIGKYTLGIYILQSIILETIMAEYIKVDGWGGIFTYLDFDIYLFFPLLSFVVLIVCAYLTKKIEQYPLLGFWLLGMKK